MISQWPTQPQNDEPQVVMVPRASVFRQTPEERLLGGAWRSSAYQFAGLLERANISSIRRHTKEVFEIHHKLFLKPWVTRI